MNTPCYNLPGIDALLDSGEQQPPAILSTQVTSGEIDNAARSIYDVLGEAGLAAELTNSIVGPQATRFELSPKAGVTLENLGALHDHFAEKLNRYGAIRMLLPIPGRDRVGIEVPNSHRNFFPTATLFADAAWKNAHGKLDLLLGRDANQAYLLDLSQGSHLLIAGYDGAGKSTLLRQFLLSILLKKTPEEVRLLFYDAKGDTFKPFAGIPHLLLPAVKEPESGIVLLDWCVQETKRRQKLLAEKGVRSLNEYQETASAENIPEILLLMDEIAPLLAVRRQEHLYELLQSLESAGKVGIHLVVATATIPSETLVGTFDWRICGQCPQSSLSQAILGEIGAEALLGKGDILWKSEKGVLRCQSAEVTAEECARMTAAVCANGLKPKYDAALQKALAAAKEAQKAAVKTASEPSLPFAEPTANDALRAVLAADKASVEVVVAALGVSQERAGNLLDELTFHEYLGSPDAQGIRQIFREKIPGEFLGKAVATRKTLETLLQELAKKIAEGDPNSRTVAEYNKGVHAIGKKIVEEAAEVWMAAEYEGPENTSLEISQLLYHLLVLMLKKQITLEDIYKQL